MGKHKSDEKKKKKKTSQLVIRVEKDERDAFVQSCDRLDTTAAREIRRFMREWVSHHAQPEAPTADEADPAAAEGQDAALGSSEAAAPAEAPPVEAPPVEVLTTKPARRRATKAAMVPEPT